ncbi:MAG: hypothetical protein H6835_11225 [Planctomycetes bacterium]|nr:hypothetical protein [Planctomycetota bacterium]
MQAHAIVELEEGSLNVLVGHRDGGDVVVDRSVRLPLPDLSQASLENALRSVGSDLLMGAKGVHVVLGERRVFHQLATLPKLGEKDAVAFVSREAMRHANIHSRDDLLLHTRLVKRLPGGKLRVATTAFSKALWRPLAEAFAAQQVEVLSLQTMESCLALSREAAGAEPVAIIECNGNRARFLVCAEGAAVQVRRFLISGGGDDNEMALATQLTMELPRTLDWLRETGQPTPKRLVIGTRVALGDESLQMLNVEDDAIIVRSVMPVVPAEGQATPDLGLATLLHHVANGRAPASLLAEPELRLPAGPAVLLTTFAAAGVAVLGGFSAVVDGGQWLEQQASQRQVEMEAQQLESSLMEREQQQAPPVDPGVDAGLQAALQMRRPISRLLAEISNLADDNVHIDSLKFASKSPVVITGFAEGDTRQQALAAMVRFHSKVDALPFLVPVDQEEMHEASSGYRFKLGLAWRNQ